jgi:hypothetical protein
MKGYCKIAEQREAPQNPGFFCDSGTHLAFRKVESACMEARICPVTISKTLMGTGGVALGQVGTDKSAFEGKLLP